MRSLGCILGLIAASGLLGCSAISYLGYLMAPGGRTEKVPAEFDGLASKTVAVVIYTDVAVQYDYPYARLGLSMGLSSELKKRIEGIKVIPSERVVTYQDQNVHWESMDRSKLGRDFDADYLLYVVLDEYTMREPGSVNLFRGRLRAHASLYDTTKPENEACVWSGEEFSVIYPRHAPTGQPGQDDSRIRYETEKRFAELLVKKFYEHEVPKE
jgi:TolB-like protein